MNKLDDFSKRFGNDKGLTQNSVDTLAKAIIGGCITSLILMIMSFFGFHVFVNEFIKELVWQKTLVMWVSILVLVNRLKA